MTMPDMKCVNASRYSIVLACLLLKQNMTIFHDEVSIPHVLICINSCV